MAENDESTETQTSPSSQRSNAECIVCIERPVTIAILPCGHACMCRPCFQKLTDCPMCRGPIQQYFELRFSDVINDAEGPVITLVQGWGAFLCVLA